MSTIHMSLWFTVRSFPFVELLRAVLRILFFTECSRSRLGPAGLGQREPAAAGLDRGGTVVIRTLLQSRAPAIAGEEDHHCSAGVEQVTGEQKHQGLGDLI